MVVLFFFRGIKQQKLRSVFFGRPLLVVTQFSQRIVQFPCSFSFLQLCYVLLAEGRKVQAIVEFSA